MVSTTPGRRGGLLGAFARDPYRWAAVFLSLTMALMYFWSVSLDGMANGANALFASGGRAPTTKPFTGPCPAGWVLPQIGPAMRERVEEEAGSWYRHLPTTLRKAYNAASQMQNMGGPSTEPDGHKRFDVIMPTVDACPNLSKVGSEGDGGKLICGLDEIVDTPANPCVVYSIGGNNQWDFEADIVKRTSCKVFTFDCTIEGRVPGDIKDRVEYHKICLGTNTAGGEAGSDWQFMRLSEIMDMLGHDHITLLKMDIEGYEYDIFDEILSEQNIHLPEQISFELHYETQMKGLDWWGRKRTAGEMALFSRRLYEAGYRIISREDNPHCRHCTELTAVRFQCPVAF